MTQSDIVKKTKRSVSFSVAATSSIDHSPQRVLQHNLAVAAMLRKPQPTHLGSFQHHSDWVNDLCLVKDSKIVTCSSDRTIYLCDEKQTATKIGHHSDYVKRLSYAADAAAIVSGGLDRRICLWDLGQLRERPKVVMSLQSPSTSVYALAVTPSASHIVSGSPDKIIRLWDHRDASKSHMELLGHTDMVRDLLISHDGKWVISASSDATIKIWSTVMPSRCVTTYTFFEDSVLCLASCSPYLTTFWAGCRDGHVAKTSRVPSSSNQDDMWESVVICQETGPVVDIAVLEDHFIWTATPSSSINCWRDVPFKKQPFPQNSEFAAGQIIVPSTAYIRNNRPLLSDAASFSSYRHSTVSRTCGSVKTPSILEQQGNAVPEMLDSTGDSDSICVEPLWKEPELTIKGGAGIVKFMMLNNRRYVLTKDSDGQVALWDIIQCVKIKSYGVVDLDEVFRQENSVEWVANWCQVDIKSGSLTVHLEEGRCQDAEIYYEDLCLVQKPQNEDQRVNLARWVLTYLLLPYMQATLVDDETLLNHLNVCRNIKRHQGLSNVSEELVADETAGIATIPFVSPIEKRSIKMDSLLSSNSGVVRRASTEASILSPVEPFSVSVQMIPRRSVSPAPEALQNTQSEAQMESTDGLQERQEKRGYLNYEETPAFLMPSPVPIIISYEESPEASSFMDVFRASQRDLSKPERIKLLEEVIPAWLYEWVVQGNAPAKETSTKISFQLLPHPKSKLPEMPVGQNRLTANRMLRVKKVIQFVADKIGVSVDPACLSVQASTSEDSSLTRLEIYFHDRIVSPRCTLATLKNIYWKSGNDVPLHYKEY